MAWTISQSGRSVGESDSLGFYVIAPQEQLARGVFAAEVDRSNIRAKIKRRVGMYSGEENHEELRAWFEAAFLPTIGKIDIRCVSWERAIEQLDDSSIREFYERCLRFNASGNS